MKIIITGSEGYIGKYLKEKISSNIEVLTLDYKTGDDITQDLESKYRSFKPDYIFHLAAQTSVQDSFINPYRNFNTNVLGTLNILQLGGKIIFASTGAIYGDRLMAKETDPLCPQSPYAISKLMAEQHIQNSRLYYVILRIGNVYGKNNLKGVIRALKEGKEIFGNGTNLRDYIYIDDVIDALVECRKWKEGIYNIGTGVDTSVNQIASLLKVEKKYAPERKEQKFISLDIHKAVRAGWHPKRKLSDYILK